MDDILDIALFDSSSEDEDVDDLLLMDLPENLARRADLYGRFSLDNISNQHAVDFFRFEKEDIPWLAACLRLPEEITTRENIKLSGVNALCILLRRLAYPNPLIDLEQMFGYSYGALSSIITTVSEIVITNKQHLLQDLAAHNGWLNEAKLQQYAQAVQQKGAPLDNCWGFIDGTIRPICRPTINQREYYSGHKRVHCVKYQSLVCPDGIVVSLKGAYPGTYHDSRILRESNLYEELQQHAVFGERSYVIYGDQGYGLRELLIRPYSQHEIAGNPARQDFNNSMKAARIGVEWGFNKIIKEFAFLDFKKNQKLLLQDVGALYSIGMILTNCHTCLYGSQHNNYFDIIPPHFEEYLGN